MKKITKFFITLFIFIILCSWIYLGFNPINIDSNKNNLNNTLTEDEKTNIYLYPGGGIGNSPISPSGQPAY